MQRLPNVHPSNVALYPTGIGTFNVGAANEGSKILFYNATQLSLQLDFLNGHSDTLHPWEANYWVLDGDTKQIQWQIDTDSLNVITPPMSAVFLTLYDTNETVSGTYPVSLPYQTSLGGGSTGTTTTSTNAIINDGNPSGTSIIESTVSGHSSTTLLTNDGLLNLLTLISGVLVQLIKTQNTGNPLLLGAVSTITEILGNLTVDGNAQLNGTLGITGNVTGSAQGNFNTVGCTGLLSVGGGITLNGGDFNTTHNIASVNNVAATTMSTTGLANFATLQSGGYFQNAGDADINGHKVLNVQQQKFNNGNLLSGINCGSFTPGSTTGTITHGLGSAPNGVIICTGDTTSTATCSAYSYTSTTFSYHVVTTGIVYNWIAMKF